MAASPCCGSAGGSCGRKRLDNQPGQFLVVKIFTVYWGVFARRAELEVCKWICSRPQARRFQSRPMAPIPQSSYQRQAARRAISEVCSCCSGSADGLSAVDAQRIEIASGASEVEREWLGSTCRGGCFVSLRA